MKINRKLATLAVGVTGNQFDCNVALPSAPNGWESSNYTIQVAADRSSWATESGSPEALTSPGAPQAGSVEGCTLEYYTLSTGQAVPGAPDNFLLSTPSGEAEGVGLSFWIVGVTGSSPAPVTVSITFTDAYGDTVATSNQTVSNFTVSNFTVSNFTVSNFTVSNYSNTNAKGGSYSAGIHWPEDVALGAKSCTATLTS